MFAYTLLRNRLYYDIGQMVYQEDCLSSKYTVILVSIREIKYIEGENKGAETSCILQGSSHFAMAYCKILR